jgi:hypothetical protein
MTLLLLLPLPASALVERSGENARAGLAARIEALGRTQALAEARALASATPREIDRILRAVSDEQDRIARAIADIAHEKVQERAAADVKELMGVHDAVLRRWLTSSAAAQTLAAAEGRPMAALLPFPADEVVWPDEAAAFNAAFNAAEGGGAPERFPLSEADLRSMAEERRADAKRAREGDATETKTTAADGSTVVTREIVVDSGAVREAESALLKVQDAQQAMSRFYEASAELARAQRQGTDADVDAARDAKLRIEHEAMDAVRAVAPSLGVAAFGRRLRAGEAALRSYEAAGDAARAEAARAMLRTMRLELDQVSRGQFAWPAGAKRGLEALGRTVGDAVGRLHDETLRERDARLAAEGARAALEGQARTADALEAAGELQSKSIEELDAMEQKHRRRLEESQQKLAMAREQLRGLKEERDGLRTELTALNAYSTAMTKKVRQAEAVGPEE